VTGQKLTCEDKPWIKVKGCKEFFQAKGSRKQARGATVISYKVYFNPKLVRIGNEGYSIIIKETIHQEEIIIFKLYVPNTNAPVFIKQIPLVLNAQIDTDSRILQYPIVIKR
jgi:hypothetical protein